MGTPDNVTLIQVAELVKKMNLPIEKLLSSNKDMGKLTANI